MSKGMRNLIAMTNVANRVFILEVGYNDKEKWIKFTDDKNTLPLDITYYRSAEFISWEDFFSKVDQIKALGYRICLDTARAFMDYDSDEVIWHKVLPEEVK